MHGVHEVARSSRVAPTCLAVALAKADLRSEIRRRPPLVDYGVVKRAVAQLVARIVRDDEAVGSNPASPTCLAVAF